VSASLSEASQPRSALIWRPGLLPSLAVATTAAGFPFDPVLAGMVAAGQGIHAICLYLGLTRAALDEHVVRLGLRSPHDRPFRNPGPRGWSLIDTICRITAPMTEPIARHVTPNCAQSRASTGTT
jgi:hypothetical protein